MYGRTKEQGTHAHQTDNNVEEIRQIIRDYTKVKFTKTWFTSKYNAKDFLQITTAKKILYKWTKLLWSQKTDV